MEDYPYCSKEQLLLDKPYHFKEFIIKDFMKGYIETRNIIQNPLNWKEFDLDKVKASCDFDNSKGDTFFALKNEQFVKTEDILKWIVKVFKSLDDKFEYNKEFVKAENILKSLRKKIEIKKLKKEYQGLKLKNSSDSAEAKEHLWLALGLALHFDKTNNLQSLSTLLKCNDYVLSFLNQLTEEEVQLARLTVSKEKEYIKELINQLSQRPLKKRLEFFDNYSKKVHSEINEKYVLNNLGMIVQDTLRTRAYLQMLLYPGLNPAKVIIIENQKDKDALEKHFNNPFFQANESVQETLIKANIPFEIVQSENFNTPQVVEALRRQKEKYYIFSGSGILKEEILSTGKKLIHVHPGWLPDFRGSTCFLYSLLSQAKCHATAFFMEAEIDTGKVIIKEKFLPPSPDLDIDRVYDPVIRAKLLVKVCQKLAKERVLEGKAQDSSSGETYYVMHPVLRVIVDCYYKYGLKVIKETKFFTGL